MPDWLFDVYPGKGGLVVWIKGETVSKHFVPYQPHFCIKAEAESLEKAEKWLAEDKRVEKTWRDWTRLWLRGPEHEVLRVQPKRLQHLHAVAQDLRKRSKSKGYLFFDVDNQPESRWMHEQGLWTMCRLAAVPSGRHDPATAGRGDAGGVDSGVPGGADRAIVVRSGGACDHDVGDAGRSNVSDSGGADCGNVFRAGGAGCDDVSGSGGADRSNESGSGGVGCDDALGGRPPGRGKAAACYGSPEILDAGAAGGTRCPDADGVEAPGVAGGTRSHGESVGVPLTGAPEGNHPCEVAWPLRPHPDDERYTIDYPDPGLRTAWLCVKVDKQGHTANLSDPLVSVRLGDVTWTVTGDTPADRASSERGILLALGERLQETDPDVIFTKHGDRFDVPYLLQAIRNHGLQEKVWLGRDRDPERPDQEGKSISTYGRWLYKTSAYYLRGRWHIDLSKKTLDSEDDRKDIHGILYLARVSNRRAQDVNRNGAGYALQQMQIDEAVDMGVAIPWKRNLAEDWKDAATLCAVDRGGQIMVPTPGIYEDVAACDFSGYYPSLVVEHNLSSDTINCDCCPDGPIVPELNYHVCEKNQGHQSGILKRIAPHRKWAKAILKKAKAQPAPGRPGEGQWGVFDADA